MVFNVTKKNIDIGLYLSIHSPYGRDNETYSKEHAAVYTKLSEVFLTVITVQRMFFAVHSHIENAFCNIVCSIRHKSLGAQIIPFTRNQNMNMWSEIYGMISVINGI